MVHLGTKRTALALYGVLLVLPTFVLGGLLWFQLQHDHQVEMQAIPGDTANAAGRLTDALREKVQSLLDREGRRAFYLYKRRFFPPDLMGAPLVFIASPLETGQVPEGVLTWFTYGSSRQTDTPIQLFDGSAASRDDGHRLGLESVSRMRELERNELDAQPMFTRYMRNAQRLGPLHKESMALPVVAVNLSAEEDIDCLRDNLPALLALQNEKVDVQISAFRLGFFREKDGTPRVYAKRIVYIPGDERVHSMPTCFATARRDTRIVQGFFIDPAWLFGELPMVLSTVILDPRSQSLLPPGEPGPSGAQFVVVKPVKELDIETFRREDEEYGMLRISMNTRELEARYRSQTVHFLGVAAMLVLSLGTGLALLLRSVQRDLESVKQTENFVAAVTHELRTPLSAIRLYGEMLEDGWVEDPEKRAEYYRRILRETARLETLVERVLQKGQLARQEIQPAPGDLNQIVESTHQTLAPDAEGERDLSYELAPGLPEVELVPECVRSIVTNLVENARKYAPVPRTDPAAERIVVATLLVGGQIALEVRDRGPGIPPAERERIFEAFYRIGNEATRQSKGTGLGLHLVALQAEAMGGEVRVLDRQGGGTIFRVTFVRAPEERAG